MIKIDKKIDREKSFSVKYDERVKKFGVENLTPLWVADMDLASPKEVVKELTKRAKHPIYGYTIYPQEYYSSIINWMKKRHNFYILQKEIIPTSGVVTSLNLIIEAFSKKGDGVIVQTPIYPPFISSVKRQKESFKSIH